MPTKIAGFILSKGPLAYRPKINPALKTKVLRGAWGQLVLYGSADFEPVAPGVWSLGFPPQTDLLQHNLLLTVGEEGVRVENDWIGGIPVFYNAAERIVSNYAQVCLREDQSFDEEGLYLFLKYGFSVMGTTPFRQIKGLRYYSTLHYTQTGLSVIEKDDPALSRDLSVPVEEDLVRGLMVSDLNRIFESAESSVVCPLSGGLDSRVLCSLVPKPHRSRVRTYTFGISPKQNKSFEAQIAQKVARKLDIKWKQIPLSKAYDDINEWHDLFGFAMHLHGMNHIEFLKGILQDLPDEGHPVLLSGLTGGAFSGGYLGGLRVERPEQLYKLALTHDLNCKRLLQQQVMPAEIRFFEQNRALLADPRWYSVVSMRLKMGLLHYLYKLPDHLGFSSCSPYHNFETVCGMLSLPKERLNNRLWVKEYFKREGLYFRNRVFHGDTRNTLNRQLFEAAGYENLQLRFWENTPMLPEQVEDLNRYFADYRKPIERIKHFLSTQRVVKEIVKMFGLKNEFNINLSAYQTLRALELSVTNRSL